jgi:membrane protein involved in colicin uptake
MWAMHQNNIIHAQSHIQFAASSLASLEQGANPVEVSNALDRVGPHIAEHLAHIQKDGYHDQELKVLTQQYEQIAQQADQLKKVIQQQAEQAQENAEKQAEAQAIQQGTDPDTQIQMAKAAADNQRKAEKHAQQMQQKAESHNIKMVTKDATTAATISQMKAKADAQMKAAAVGKATEDNT